MLRSLVFAAAVTMLSAPVMSAATSIPIPWDDDALIVPQGSPLQFGKFGAEHAVEFKGAIELSGTWYYGDNPNNDGGPPDPELFFVPDDASLARLPRFKARGQPGDIFLTNSMDLLKQISSATDRAKAEKKGGKYLSGHITIAVDQFEAGIECDASYFDAHFVHVVKPPMRVALGGMPEDGC